MADLVGLALLIIAIFLGGCVVFRRENNSINYQLLTIIMIPLMTAIFLVHNDIKKNPNQLVVRPILGTNEKGKPDFVKPHPDADFIEGIVAHLNEEGGNSKYTIKVFLIDRIQNQNLILKCDPKCKISGYAFHVRQDKSMVPIGIKYPDERHIIKMRLPNNYRNNGYVYIIARYSGDIEKEDFTVESND